MTVEEIDFRRSHARVCPWSARPRSARKAEHWLSQGGSGGQASPRYAWWRQLHPDSHFQTKTEQSKGLPSAPNPSEHLQWAKQVNAEQKKWWHQRLHYQRTAYVGSHKEEPPQQRPRMKSDPASWAETLREQVQHPHPPCSWHEQRHQRNRTQWGLRRLRSMQEKWRQDHAEQHQRGTLTSKCKLVDTDADEASAAHDDQNDLAGKDTGTCLKGSDDIKSSDGLNTPTRVSPVVPQSPSGRNSRASSSVGRSTGLGMGSGALGLPVISKSAEMSHDKVRKQRSRALSKVRHPLPGITHVVSMRSESATPCTCRCEREEDAETSAHSGDQQSLLWDKWRVEFTPGVLDLLAEAWKTLGVNESGELTVSITQLKSILAEVLDLDSEQDLNRVRDWHKFLPELVGDPSHEDTCVAIVPTLHLFLEAISASLSHIEEHEISLLWTEEDRMTVESAMQRYVLSSGHIPVEHLFDVIGEVYSVHICTSSVEKQRRLMAIVRAHLQSPTTRREQRVTLSLHEVLFIMTFALMEDDRQRRREELKREDEVRVEAGFTRVEMEVVRELHLSYLDLETPPRKKLDRDFRGADGDDSVTRLSLLLGSCGVTQVTEAETLCLKDIVRRHRPEVLGACVPLTVFTLWMSEVFKEHICGLTRESLSPSDFQASKAFTAAMVSALRLPMEADGTGPAAASEPKARAAEADDVRVVFRDAPPQ